MNTQIIKHTKDGIMFSVIPEKILNSKTLEYVVIPELFEIGLFNENEKTSRKFHDIGNGEIITIEPTEKNSVVGSCSMEEVAKLLVEFDRNPKLFWNNRIDYKFEIYND